MKRILFLLLFVATMFSAPSQSFAQGQQRKLSPYLRTLAEKNLTIAKDKKTARKPSLVTTFVKATNPDVLTATNCRILAQWDDLYIVSLPVDALYTLAAKEGVMRIEASKPMNICNDTTAQLLGVSDIRTGLNLPQAYTGKGVVAGIMDIGFDFTHPTFSDRISRFWDMIDNRDSIPAVTVPFGKEYIGNDTLKAIQHSYDGLIATHGTHTAGSMAGNGYLGRYVGMAPESEIVMVSNACGENRTLIDEEYKSFYTTASDALGFKYIFDYAESQGKPCVINFSEGSEEDPWNGQLYAEALSHLVGPGKILVASIGNQNNRKRYAHKPAGIDSLKINDTEYYNAFLYYVQADKEVTNSILLSNRKTLTWTTEQIAAAPDSILRDTVSYGTRKLATCVCLYPDCWGKGKLIYEITIMPVDGEMLYLPFDLVVKGTDADADIFFVTGSPDYEVAEYGHNTLFPGNTPYAIAVGANGYRDYVINYLGTKKVYQTETDGMISNYSSRGPTMDGRTKPDIVAPGNNILSSYNSFYLENHKNASDVQWDVEHFEYNGRTYPWNANSGTSMSSPVVAGIIALWLEANPNLSPTDILDIFAHTARHTDSSLTYPNNDYGYGEIDAYAGLQYMLQTMDIKSLTKTNSEGSANAPIYNLNGLRVNKNYQGIVIVNGKKYIQNSSCK